jgi:spermidine/putrescine transport system substrate-binding protein
MRKLSWMQNGLALLLAMVFVGGILGVPGTTTAAEYKNYEVPQECLDQVKKEGSKLFIYDWAEWWPEELFENFSKEYGVKIVRDHYADTEEMVTKFKLNPKTPYDLVLGAGPSNVIQMRPMGLIQELNHDWLPNLDAYLMDEFKNMDFDPGNRYQVPDSVFLTTYTFNSKYVDMHDPLVGTWKFMFENEKYAGKMTMIDNMYETIGAALKYLGYSWNSDVESELMEAKEVLLKQKPRLMAYDSWPRRLLVEEEAWISNLWVGDGWLLSQDVPTMKGVLPAEGTYIATNTDFIPKGSQHPATAHLFLNYLFRTDVNAMLVGWIGYPPCHKHVMESMTPEMKAWPGFIIPKEYLAKCDGVEEKALVGKGKELRIKIWEQIKK